MTHQLQDTNGIPPELFELHASVRRTRGLRKRRRITALADDSELNHRSIAYFNPMGP